MSLFSFIHRSKPKTPDRVSFTTEAVTRVRPDGVEETIHWDDLHEVGILTTDEGGEASIILDVRQKKMQNKPVKY